MKVFIQRDTRDASLCRTALSVLESFVTLLQQLVDGKTDLLHLIEATLVDEDGRPRTEHGQRPSELLVELAENGDSTYQKYHKLEDDIHIQTRYKRPADNKKGRHFCRHVLRKRYAACVTLFGICTDVRPGPAGFRL